MKTITTPIQIRFSDVDLAQHVHNAVYLQWFELGRMGFLESIIPKDHDWKAQGLILARNEVDYRMPVRLRDTLVVDVWCSAVGSKSFDLSYSIRREGGEQPGVCAEGRSVMVCFDYTTQRTIPVPDDWRRGLEGSLAG
jgi:acyl-CoA thioester hydrolase